MRRCKPSPYPAVGRGSFTGLVVRRVVPGTALAK